MSMRGRLGLVLGFGGGYYLGAKAGEERYEEINRYLQRLRGTSVGQVVDTAASKTKEVVNTTAEQARESIEQIDADRATSPDLTTTATTTTTTVSPTTGFDTTGVVVATTEGDVAAAALADDLPPYTKPL